ncbi:MAG: hypothetical protein JO109_15620 [Alphaproteobacteria bacterium]|nr:hypothetical protein [Alphaproteobacteria bacterium]
MTYVQTASWAAAAASAIIGVVGFCLERKKLRRQREEELDARREANAVAARELAWRQALAAQTSLEKLEEDEEAADAMLMLDWDARGYRKGDQTWFLTRGDILHALRTRGDAFDDAEVYVRDAFDHLFWHFERIQNQIEVNLLQLKHVRFPLAYLVARMDLDRDVFETFLESYCYDGARQLIASLREAGLPAAPTDHSGRFGPAADQAAPIEVAAPNDLGGASATGPQGNGPPPG